jgi:hypothetical protein
MKWFFVPLVFLTVTGAALAQPASTTREPDIIVPTTRERPVEAPNEDPRPAFERRRDRSAFDRCVMRLEAKQSESNAANPVAASPEEYCGQRLGMRDRDSVPDRRRKN